MTKSELYAVLPFCDTLTIPEICKLIHAENYPGIDNQMKAHVYGPWLEFDYSDAFAASEFEVQSAFTCPDGKHDWEDDSYGGPESGCMAGHCKRCGFSFHEQLY